MARIHPNDIHFHDALEHSSQSVIASDLKGGETLHKFGQRQQTPMPSKLHPIQRAKKKGLI